MTSSLYEPDSALLSRFNNLEELTRVVRTERVQTRRLDDLPEITNIDLLKIDVQGAELDVFRGAERLLKGAVVVYTEVEFLPMYKGQPLFADVDAHLRGLGFRLHGFADGLLGRAFKPVVPTKDGINARFNQVIWSDAVYVRDFMRLNTLSAEKLLKLAVILHDLVCSFDLANLVMRAHDEVAGTSLWRPYMTRLLGVDPGPPPAFL